MTHQFKLAVLAVLAALVVLTTVGTAKVDAAVVEIVEDKWNTALYIDGNTVSDTYRIVLSSVHCLYVTDIQCPGEQFQVTINGVDKGITSPTPGRICPAPATSPDEALTRPAFSRGIYPLAAGSTSLVFKRVNGTEPAMAFNVKMGACPAPPAPIKVVTSAGKVLTRAAAVAACAAEGRVLANVTAANKEELLKVVRASPDIKLNPYDGVMVASSTVN
ncbi:hypothetical protein GGF32_008375 [Allomyces javanicus]|nr:hypothetical protein GGF32_008375 [Allomyces javanicus]